MDLTTSDKSVSARCSSPAGGPDVDSLLENFVKLSVDTSASPCHAVSSCKPLREYQRSIVCDVCTQYEEPATKAKRSALIYLPTGGGKTRIAAELFRMLVCEKGAKCMFLVNRSKLIEQAAGAFTEVGLGPHLSYIKAGKSTNADGKLFIASIQTIMKRFFPAKCTPAHDGPALPDISMLVIDEAHGSMSESYRTLISYYAEHAATANIFVLGLTATPMRLDPSELLSTVFMRLIRGPSVNQLIGMGVLVPPMVIDAQYAAPKATAFQSVSTPIETDLENKALEFIVQHWQKRCCGRLTVAFAADVDQSNRLVAAFNRSAIRAAHIDGETTEKDRIDVYEQFHNREILVLSSVGVLSEGFDEPAVSCVILCRPTHSKTMYIQQVGRGLRCFSGKSTCVVLDTVGATEKHGPVTGPLGFEWEWDDGSAAPLTLGGIKIAGGPKSGGNGHLPPGTFRPKSWTCKALDCSTVNHIASRTCQCCGASKPLGKPFERSTSEGRKQTPVLSDISLAYPFAAASNVTLPSKVVFKRPAPIGSGFLIPRKSEAFNKATSVGPVERGVSIPSNKAIADTSATPAAPPANALEKIPSPSGASFSGGTVINSGEKAQPSATALLEQRPPAVPALAALPSSDAIPGPRMTPSTVFGSSEFRLAITKLKLPLFGASMGRNAWENEFLCSIACQITEGAPSPYKPNASVSKALSAKQLEILHKITSRVAKAVS